MAGLQIRFIGLIVVISLLIAGGSFLAKQFLPKGNSSKSTQQTNQLDQANNQASAGNNKDVKIQGLPTLPASASSQQQTEFLNTASEKAVETNKVELTNCKPNNASIRLKKGENLNIKKNDNRLIVVDFNSSNVFPVDGKKEFEAKLNLKTGFHFLSCQHSAEDHNPKAGIVEIVE